MLGSGDRPATERADEAKERESAGFCTSKGEKKLIISCHCYSEMRAGLSRFSGTWKLEGTSA